MGLSTLQKCTIGIRMLVYKVLVDVCDEYCRLEINKAKGFLGMFGSLDCMY